MRAQLRNNGRLVVNAADGTEVVALELAAHLEGWKWQTQLPGEPVDGSEHQTVRAELPGVAAKNVIGVTTSAWQEPDGRIIMEVAAQSSPAAEERVCSLCVHLFLEAALFEGATICGQLALSLAEPGSAPREDCNPFSASVAGNHYHDMAAFSVLTKDKRIAFDVALLDGGQRGVVFTDVRKWGPRFDLRLGDSTKSPFGFSSGKWRVALQFVGGTAPVKLQDTRFPALTAPEVEAFKRDGFCVMDDIVPPDAVDDVVRVINASLGTKNELKYLRSPLVARLFNDTRIRAIVQQLIGAKRVPEWSGDGAQVALIFPTLTPGTSGPLQFGYHIDGIPTENNGLEQGRLHPFSMLVGVYLSDMHEDRMGNLILYPGSHIKHAEHFRQHGPESLLANPKEFKMPVRFDNPHVVKVRRGGVVFAHYLTAHGIFENNGALLPGQRHPTSGTSRGQVRQSVRCVERPMDGLEYWRREVN